MHSNDSLSFNHNTKWQRMAVIVDARPELAYCESDFKKMTLRRLFAENLLVFLLQYIGLMFSTLTPAIYPLWFASGTACAFVFLRGASVLPGIGLGSWIAFYFVKAGFVMACVGAALLMLQAYLLWWCSCRYIVPTLIFYRTKNFIKFLFCAALITLIVSSILKFICHSSMHNLMQWWLANLNGILIFAFALITLDAFFPQISGLKYLNKYYLSLIFGVLFLSVVGFVISQNIMFLMVNVFIVFLIRYYYRWCGAIAAIFLSALFLSLATSFEMVDPKFILYIQIILMTEIVIYSLF